MTDPDQRHQTPRRKSDRRQASFQVTVTASDGDHICTIVNLSKEGAMVRGAIENQPGTLVAVNMPKFGLIRAVVIWNDGETFGLSFDFKNKKSTNKSGPIDHEISQYPLSPDRRQK